MADIINTDERELDYIAFTVYQHIKSLEGKFYTYHQMRADWNKFKRKCGYQDNHYAEGDKLCIWSVKIPSMNGIRSEGFGDKARIQYRKDLAKMQMLTTVTPESRQLIALAVIEIVQKAGPAGISKTDAIQAAFNEIKMGFDLKKHGEKELKWIGRIVVTRKTQIVSMPSDSTRWVYLPEGVTTTKPAPPKAREQTAPAASKPQVQRTKQSTEVQYTITVIGHKIIIAPIAGMVIKQLFGNATILQDILEVEIVPKK